MRKIKVVETEYKDNETYEKVKAKVIESLLQHINDTFSIDAADVADILNLLSQSKWIGTDEIHLTEKSNLPPETLKGGFFWDDDDEDSDFYLI